MRKKKHRISQLLEDHFGKLEWKLQPSVPPRPTVSSTDKIMSLVKIRLNSLSNDRCPKRPRVKDTEKIGSEFGLRHRFIDSFPARLMKKAIFFEISSLKFYLCWNLKEFWKSIVEIIKSSIFFSKKWSTALVLISNWSQLVIKKWWSSKIEGCWVITPLRRNKLSLLCNEH